LHKAALKNCIPINSVITHTDPILSKTYNFKIMPVSAKLCGMSYTMN